MTFLFVTGLCLLFTGVTIGLVCAINGVLYPLTDEETGWNRRWRRGHAEGKADIRVGVCGIPIGLLVWWSGLDLSGFWAWWGLIGFFGLSLEVIFVALSHRQWWGYCSTGYIPIYWLAVPFFYCLWPWLCPPNIWWLWLVKIPLYGVAFHGAELVGMWVWRQILLISHSEVGYYRSGRGIFDDLIRWDYFPGWVVIGFLFEGVYRLLELTATFHG